MTATTMHRRFLAIAVLAAALLFSQGGNFLIAALCPHLQSGIASCETQWAQAPMSHQDMGHMGHMEMEPEPASQPNPDAAALGQPIGTCLHCAVHSRTTPNTASLRDLETTRRSVDLNIPLHFSKVAPVTLSAVAVLTSRAHGPPGEAVPRHILINIFRI
jgi:hypothetical protein